MQLAVERKDIGAIYCLLRGMHHKYNYWKDTFVDEDTNEEVECLRCDIVEGSTFEKNEGEEERLVQIVMKQKHCLSVENLAKLCDEISDNKELLLERIKKYYDLAGDIPYKEEWDDTDDPGEEFPCTYQYELTGNVETLNGVETLINDLCQKFGTPDNECGLYVPQRQLISI